MSKIRITTREFLSLGLGLAGTGLLGCGGDEAKGKGDSGAGGSGSGGSGGSGGKGGSGGSGGTGGSSGGGGSGGSSAMDAGAKDSSSPMDSGKNAAACAGEISADISANHGHELKIPLADIMAGKEKCYNAQGASNHAHYITVTAADFTALKDGKVVTKVSCSGTQHEYTLSCKTPPAAGDPTMKCAADPKAGTVMCK